MEKAQNAELPAWEGNAVVIGKKSGHACPGDAGASARQSPARYGTQKDLVEKTMRLLRGWPWLVTLTLVALLPWAPQGPFDARDYARIAGAHLEYPILGVVLEPLLAPAQVLTGAPDFRLALLSTAIWTVALAAFAGLMTARGPWRRARRAAGWATSALGLLILYTLVIALVPLPGWRLVVDDPDTIIADLQSHTLGSHDGLVTAEENLRWHKARGYEVVAITEHKVPAGAFAAQAYANAHPDLPAVIPGVEVRGNEGEFLLGLGLRPDRPVLLDWNPPQDYAREFVRDIHETHGGAVVALSWLIGPRLVGTLAAAGIDGIEAANTGHPDLPETVRDAVLKSQAKGLALVASTDWHGWGGFTRTWSLVKVPGAAAMNGPSRASAVVELLRGRKKGAFTPVVAGYIGPPPAWRLALSPWVESLRYAAELAPARVLSWWFWSISLAVAARHLRGRGLRPLRLLGAAAVAGLGMMLTLRASELLGYRVGGAAHEYAVEMGKPALMTALMAILAGVLMLGLEWRRVRASRKVHPVRV